MKAPWRPYYEEQQHNYYRSLLTLPMKALVSSQGGAMNRDRLNHLRIDGF
jgi:hypothetical protein